MVQSEPRSHTEYVHFEPSPVMVSISSIKDFHVVRANKDVFRNRLRRYDSLSDLGNYRLMNIAVN
ncbi:MAG: hypothetical protein AB7V56_16660 [Candidatus Nitrosocosmicus sp.]